MNKKIFTILIFALVLTLFASCDNAKTNLESDFEYISEHNEVTITKYIGDTADVVIPRKIDGKKITTIHDEAFFQSDSLASVSIPDSVTTIADNAFLGCESLSEEIKNKILQINLNATFE